MEKEKERKKEKNTIGINRKKRGNCRGFAISVEKKMSVDVNISHGKSLQPRRVAPFGRNSDLSTPRVRVRSRANRETHSRGCRFRVLQRDASSRDASRTRERERRKKTGAILQKSENVKSLQETCRAGRTRLNICTAFSRISRENDISRARFFRPFCSPLSKNGVSFRSTRASRIRNSRALRLKCNTAPA